MFLASLAISSFLTIALANITYVEFLDLPVGEEIVDMVHDTSDRDIYVAGHFASNLPSFIRKYDGSTADLKWDVFHGNNSSRVLSLDRANDNRLFALGYTYGSYYGFPHMGDKDAMILSVDRRSGNFTGYNSWGTPGEDMGIGQITSDSSLNILSRENGLLNTRTLALDDENTNLLETSFLFNYPDEWTESTLTPVLFHLIGSNHIYCVGYTSSNLFGTNVTGLNDVFAVEREASSFTTSSYHLIGSSVDDVPLAAEYLDDLEVLFVTGYTTGNFKPGSHAGQKDIFVFCQRLDGTLVWKQQWGTVGDDYGSGIAYNLTEIIVTGSENGRGFISRRYSSSGTEIERLLMPGSVDISHPLLEDVDEGQSMAVLVKQADRSFSVARVTVFDPPPAEEEEDTQLTIPQISLENNLAIIVGSVLGVLIFCCLLIGAVIYWLSKRIEKNKAKAFGAPKDLMEDQGPPHTDKNASMNDPIGAEDETQA